MKIIDLMEEKEILQQRFSDTFFETQVIGREGSFAPQKAKTVFNNYHIAMKRYDEISDKLNQVMSKTFVKVDDRKISVATAMECIRIGGRLIYSQLGVQAPFSKTDDLDLYYSINSRIACQIQMSTSKWNSDDEDDLAGTKLIDPNGVLEKNEFYKYFCTDYLVKLKMAVQRAIVLTDVE